MKCNSPLILPNLACLWMLLCFSSCGDFDDLVLEQLITREDRPPGVKCEMESIVPIGLNDVINYSTDEILCVEIEMDSNDFESLKEDTRFGVSASDEGAVVDELQYMINNCEEPWPKEYIWYKGSINVDGKMLQDVGIRKKGLLGSIFSDAPSCKIKTDKFVDEQFFGESERLTLNNNSEDASRIVSSLMYHIFAMAGYPASKCNLANVNFNGNSLGPYSNVEPVKKRFLQFHFGNNEGDLYEGAIVDFNMNALNRWEAKTNQTDESKTKIIKIIEAMAGSEDDVLEKLEPLVNIEAFIKFWALEIVVNHKDGYTSNQNNFFVYFNPNDNNRAHFIPWGIGAFDAVNKENDNTVINEFTTSNMAILLSRNTETKQWLKDELQRLIDEVWNEAELIALIDVLSNQIKSAQTDESYEMKVETVKKWVRGRKSDIQNALAKPFPSVSGELNGC